MTRRPSAPHFYSGDCAEQVEQFLEGFTPPADIEHPIAGVVPHAGWVFSGAVAAKVIRCLSEAGPETFVIFGAVHSWGVQPGAVYASGAWATPLGSVAVDEDLAALLLDQCSDYLVDDPNSHAGEHSIEVQVPIIHALLPAARVVPIAMPPSGHAAAAGAAVGAALARSGAKAVVLGSSDLTHYGPGYGFAPWGRGAGARERMRANDRRIIDLALGFASDKVVAEAAAHSNACGAGAIAAVVAAAQSMGARKSVLIEYTTSHDVTGEAPQDFQMAVGYAGLLFGR